MCGSDGYPCGSDHVVVMVCGSDGYPCVVVVVKCQNKRVRTRHQFCNLLVVILLAYPSEMLGVAMSIAELKIKIYPK